MSARFAKRKKSRVLRFLAGALLAVALLVCGAGLSGYLWLQSYLRSEEFRLMLARQLGRATNSRVVFGDLELSGPSVYVSSATMHPRLASGGWKGIEADRLEATVEWNALRDGVVKIPRVYLDWAELQLGPAEVSVGELPLELDQEVEPPPLPEWARRWMPRRTDVGELKVERFVMRPGKADGLGLENLELTARPSPADDRIWQLNGKGGTLKVPGLKEAFRLSAVTGQVGRESFVLHDATALWMGDAEVTGRGMLPFGEGKSWLFSGTFRGLEVQHFLSEALKPKLAGRLEGTYEVHPDHSEAKVTVLGGVMHHLPVLDRVAEFTRTDRFRRLVLDEARLDVWKQGERLRLRNLVLHSNDLVRVEGTIEVLGRQLEGDLYVGVTTSSLRWIPGSQKRVFTESRPGSPAGFVWTRVRLSGTVGEPKEDLSNRLLAAMGKALILDAPLGAAEMGVEVLGGAGGAAKGTVETGRNVLEGAGNAAGKAVEGGVDLLKKVIPVFGK